MFSISAKYPLLYPLYAGARLMHRPQVTISRIHFPYPHSNNVLIWIATKLVKIRFSNLNREPWTGVKIFWKYVDFGCSYHHAIKRYCFVSKRPVKISTDQVNLAADAKNSLFGENWSAGWGSQIQEESQCAIFLKWLTLPRVISSDWTADTDQVTTDLIFLYLPRVVNGAIQIESVNVQCLPSSFCPSEAPKSWN